MTSCEQINVINLGLRAYSEVLHTQRSLQQALINGSGAEHLLICQHTPVITYGKGAKRENILLSEDELRMRGVELIAVDRGGDVTYHGPSQLIAYPILDLRRRKQDVGWYMRCLEEVIIKTLLHFSIDGYQVAGKTGVWVGKQPRKIASIGVRLSRWCSMHGLALNINKETAGFSLIHPCGLVGVQMTSIEEEGETQTIDSITEILCLEFMRMFGGWPRS